MLKALQTLVEAIIQEAGVPGVAIGIVHRRKVIHEAYHGYRDVEAGLPVDRDTIFHVASLTKGMTATALGILVDRGKLEWNSPIHEILPEMSRETEIYAARVTVLDILSHSTGKAWADALYLQSNNRVLLPKQEAIPIFDYLPQVEPARSRYMYNNHAYNIAGLVIEKVSGMSWEEFMLQNIFSPLDMSRTFARHVDVDDHNVAAPYNILTDRTPWRLPFCNVSNETMVFAGQSIRTTTADLLKYSMAYLQSLQGIMLAGNESRTDCLFEASTQIQTGYQNSRYAASKNNPIRNMATIVRPRIARPVDSLLEQTYALGWNRTQLPGSLDFGCNQDMIKPFPRLGERFAGRLAIWHGGNMPGTISAICLLPETQSAVVVLQNSLGLCDVSYWICQACIDTLMLGKPDQDYLSLTSACVKASTQRMVKVEQRLEAERILGTESRPLEAYTGQYFNLIKNWFIDIEVSEGELVLNFLGREDEEYHLRHYHYDTFCWSLPYDALVKRGQYIRAHEYY